MDPKRVQGMGVDRRDPDVPTAVVTAAPGDLAVPVPRLPDLSFEDFYRREYPRIRTLARVLVGGPTSDDIAQEALLVAYRRWRDWSRLADPARWVRRVCVNLATSHLRRRGVEARALVRLGARPRPLVVLADDDETFWAAVRSLPRRQAQVVALFYVHDLTVADVAATLELSEGSVKTHLSRARTALSQRLVPGDEGE
jgi:RNA polymerase sigma factor (sigma-70 family)